MRASGADNNSYSPISNECVTSESFGSRLGKPTPPLAFVIPCKRPERPFRAPANFASKCRQMFKAGKNTTEIAASLNAPEAAVYNAMAGLAK